MKTLERLIRQARYALSRSDYSHDCLCQHHGVIIGEVGHFRLDVSPSRGLLVHAAGREPGYSWKVFNVIVTETERASDGLGVGEWWAGGTWISVPSLVPVPPALSLAVGNYLALTDPFLSGHDSRFKAFHDRFEVHMRDARLHTDDELELENQIDLEGNAGGTKYIRRLRSSVR